MNSAKNATVTKPAMPYANGRDSGGKCSPSGAISIYEALTIVMNNAGIMAIK